MTASLRVLPNITAMVRQFLLTDPDVTGHVANRVYIEVPLEKTYPLVRVVRFGGVPRLPLPLELDSANLQLDVWADSDRVAERAMQTIRAALSARLPGAHDYGAGLVGVINFVDFGSMAGDPDDVFDPPKPRYRCDITVGYQPALAP